MCVTNIIFLFSGKCKNSLLWVAWKVKLGSSYKYNFLSYMYYATGLDDMAKVRKALFMFVDLFGLERYPFDTLVRNICQHIQMMWIIFQVSFIVTVKTNYRSVAYHNWAHGFHVCNSIYSILKASPGIFTPLEVNFSTNQIHWNQNVKCVFSALAFGLELFAMIWTTEGSTTSSWLISGLRLLPFTQPLPWKIITLQWGFPFCSRCSYHIVIRHN